MNAFTTIICNCLRELKKNRHKSIGFPAIGTGMLNYSHDLVAKLITYTSDDFLRDNKAEKFDIQIIIFDRDVDVYEVKIWKTTKRF